MQLHELKKSQGRKAKAQKVGRGNSSNKGNYCGKGMKGQKARAGGGVPEWFEGGQTPLHMRLPKLRGFKRYFKLLKDVTPVSLEKLGADDRVSDGATINLALLFELGYNKHPKSGVKILGKGPVKKKLSFEGKIAFSASARAAIEKAGGSIAE